MDMFPVKKTHCAGGAAGRIKSTDSISVYCVCRYFTGNGRYTDIECTKCKEWYHTDSCMTVPALAITTSITWFCDKCQE